jgi:flagellar hook-length control protein FliK
VASYAALPSPVGHPAFGVDLAQRVLILAGQRVQTAEISVAPEELGPIRIAIEVRGQEAALQFAAAHPLARAAIEEALPRLREMFAAQGLQLTQAEVGEHARDPGSSHGGHGSSRDGAPAPARAAAVESEAAAAAPAVRRVGLIDIRV